LVKEVVIGRDLFMEGGPQNIRRTAPDEYTFSISIPPDEERKTARCATHCDLAREGDGSSPRV
jgi:hypothetical protein